METKKWYLSRAVWSALFQVSASLFAAIGLFLVDGDKNALGLAIVSTLKGFYDLYVRVTTNTAVN